MLAQIGKNVHRADVIAEVRKGGATLAGLARHVGLSRQSFSWALIKPHPRANEAIASFLGVHVHTLWPEWFDLNGRCKVRGLPRRKPIINSRRGRRS